MNAPALNERGPYASWLTWPIRGWGRDDYYYRGAHVTRDGRKVWRCVHAHPSRGEATACAQATLDKRRVC